MAKEKIKTVVAEVREVTEPKYEASFKCPHCTQHDYISDIEEENTTIKHECFNCKKKYKVKIPKNIFD